MRVQFGEQVRETSRGVPQGAVMSPLLFNLYIDDLLDELDVSGIHAQLFADDGIIIARNRSELLRGI